MDESSKSKQLIFVIAAALAAGGSWGDADHGATITRADDGSVEIPASFGGGVVRTDEGYLRTAKNYGVRIDRLSLDPEVLDLAVKERGGDTWEMELGEVISRTSEVSGRTLYGGVEDPEQVGLILKGVQLEGRVFDLEHGSERLPDDGVQISGTLAIDVNVRKARRIDLREPGQMREFMEVDFEVPSEHFDRIDWAGLLGPTRGTQA